MGRVGAGLLVAALLAAGCSGGGDGGGDGEAADRAEEQDEADSAPDAEDESRSGFRAEGTIDAFGFETDVLAIVVDAETYRLRFDGDLDLFREEIRIGGDHWARDAPSAGAADERFWVEADAEVATAQGALQDLRQFGPENVAGATGADLSAFALSEILLTDPEQLVDLAAIEGEEARLEPDLPEDIADALDELDVDEPELELDVTLEGKTLVEAELEVSGDGLSFQTDVVYADHGGVAAAEVVAPDEATIDPTPWLDEEELARFDDAPLVAPASPPAGLVLVSLFVLDPGETFEGCPQVELDYDAPPPRPPGDDFLTLFLLSKPCATGADPEPFDETYGGFPSRYDGYEVLVGDTVVQIAASDGLYEDETALEAVAASLAGVDRASLLAGLVPAEG